MKKRIFFLLAAAFVVSATSSSGEDITTRDGTVYKNIYIEGVNPSGIDIGYIDARGVFVLKGLNFANLPENIQKQYGYVPANATQFNSKVNQYANSDIDSVASSSQTKVNKIIQEIKAKVSGSDVQIEPADLSYAVFALRRSVTVKPAYAVSTGCVVEVESVKSGKAIPNKKILLDGVNLPGYSNWTGFVYPTGAKANFGNDKGIPVFTDNLDRSVQILKKYLNIYGEYAANNTANPVNTDASASSVATDAPDLSQNSYASQNPPPDNSQTADNSQVSNTQAADNTQSADASQPPVQNNYYYGNDGNYNDGYGFSYYMGGGYYPVDWYRRNRYNPYNPHRHYPQPLYRNDGQKKVQENREPQNREQANKQLENRERVNRSAASSRENIDSFAKNYYGERAGNFHQSNYNRGGEGGNFNGGERSGGERGGFSGGRSFGGGGRR